VSDILGVPYYWASDQVAPGGAGILAQVDAMDT